jgi:putative MATE family efflux protein
MTNQNNNVLGSGDVGRLLLKLSFPMFIGMSIQAIYSVVDVIFIGHFVGSLGIAGVSVVFPLQMLVNGVAMMVGVGGASLISRRIGAGDNRSAERALGNGISFAIIFSLLLTAAILPTMDFWLSLVGASENVLPYARVYLTIFISGVVISILGMALLTYARSEGNARVVMVAYIISSLLNVILDAIFIISLHMGVAGAALATLISQGSVVIYALWYYFSGDSYLKIHIGNLKPDLKIFKEIFSIGVASFAQALATTVAVSILIRVAADYGGDIALSAFGVIQRIMNFAFMPGQVIGQGMQPVLGYNYGAGRYRLASKSVVIACLAATACSIFVFIILFVFPTTLMSLFTSDQELLALAVHASRYCFAAVPLMGIFTIGSMVFPAVGKPWETMAVSLTRPLVFLLPLALLFPRLWQLDGIWLAFPGGDVLTFLLTVALLIPLLMEFKKAAAVENPPSRNPAS